MSSSHKTKPGPIMAAFGTSLMDRVNVFFKLRRYIKMIAERWVILVLCTAVGGGIGIRNALRTHDSFQAVSEIGIAPKLQVQHDVSKAVMIEDVNNYYDRQISAMNSDTVRSNILRELGAQKLTPPPLPSEGTTQAKRVPQGNNILMTVTSADPGWAKAYAAAWASQFINYREQVKQDLIDRKASLTRQEVERYQNALKQVREEIAQFRQTNQVYNEEEAIANLQKQLESNQTKYEELQTQISQLKHMNPEAFATTFEPGGGRRGAAPNSTEAKTDVAGAKAEVPQDSAGRDPSAKYEATSRYPELKRNFEVKTAERVRWSETLKERHPYMLQLAQDIAKLGQDINLELQSLDERRNARIASLTLLADTYPSVIKDLQDKLFSSTHLLITFKRLGERETDTKNTLDTLQHRLEELSVPQDDDGTFAILSAGQDRGPINANRSKIILTAFLIGIAIGLGIIYTLGRLDDRLELAEEIEAELEEPVLGQIPLVDKKTLNVERVMITRLDEHSMFAESIRGVRSAVMLGMQGGPKQVMLVTSAVPSDGKTTITVNFAVTLAIAGNRVLLIDADLRRGNVHSYFDLPRDPGYSEVLQGELHWRDAVQKTEVRTLALLSSGKLPANPGELLMGSINRQFMEEIRQAYDYVVFDCPPLTAIDDTFSLVGGSDGMLFVVRSGQTSMRFAAGALDAVRKRGAQIMGLILNGITADNPYYYYKNYYHEYYNKGTGKSTTLIGATLPSAKMAMPRENARKVASIEDEAKARSGQEHLMGAVSPENTKAVQFRAIRAAKKLQSAPVKAAKPEEES